MFKILDTSELVGKDRMKDYTTVKDYEGLMIKIDTVSKKLEEKLQGGEDNPTNSTPVWGAISVISANYDGSFFIRWECAEPKGRRLKYRLNIGQHKNIEVTPWYNGNNYTLFVPKGLSVVGNNVCSIVAINKTFEAVSNDFIVNIPKEYENTAPLVSQDMPNLTLVVNQVVSIIYTATDNKIIQKHEFFNGDRLIDITSRVIKNGDQYEYRTSFEKAITVNEAYIRVMDNEGGQGSSNKFKIVVS